MYKLGRFWSEKILLNKRRCNWESRNPNFTTKRKGIQRNKENVMMKKQAQMIFANFRRSIASSPVSARAKYGWKEQNKFVLGLTFVGGWFGQAAINAYKRREHRIRVYKYFGEEKKRLRGEIDRHLRNAEMKKLDD